MARRGDKLIQPDPSSEDRDGHSYWKEQARAFSSYYGRQGFSLRRSVSAFLDARTRLLRTLAGWDETSSVLDLGCGSGVHMLEIAPRCHELVGVDYSAQMLESARVQLQALALANWKLEQADAQALPFQEQRFDWIVSMGLLDYVPSPAAVLAECRRVLRLEGRLIVSLPKRPSAFFWLRTRLGDRLKARLFDLPPVRNVLGRRELLALLREAGFEPESIDSVWSTMWVVRARRAR